MKKQISIALSLGLLASAATAQTTRTFVFEGAATSADSLQLGFASAGSTPSCDVYFDCTFLLNWCTDLVPCPPGTTGAGVATRLANAVNSPSGCGANLGFSASVNGNVLTIQNAGPFEVCLAAAEIVTCSGNTDSLRLDGCDVSNVLNGISCDETAAHVSGVRIHEGSAVCTPVPSPFNQAGSFVCTSSPVLGTTWTGTTVPAGAPSMLAISTAAQASPPGLNTAFAFLEPPTTLQVLPPFKTNPSPNGMHAVPIPSDLGLIGRVVSTQTFTVVGVGPLLLRANERMDLTLGL